jgi:hypothetical protein
MPNKKWCLFLVGSSSAHFDKKNVIKWFGTCTDIQNIKETGIELLRLNTPKNQTD